MIPTFFKKDFSVAAVIFLLLFTEATTAVFAQTTKLFLGIKLRADVQAIVEEIERKTKKEIYAEYIEFVEDE